MPLKDILIHLDASRACETRVAAAVRLAREHGAALTGLYVRPLPLAALGAGGEIGVPPGPRPELAEGQRAAELERARAARERWRRLAGAEAPFHEVAGDPLATLCLYSRCFDLLLAGQPSPADPESLSRGVADGLVMDAGCPVLWVPWAGVPERIGTRVLVAWNGSRQAARALRGALPLLARAGSVEVLTVGAIEGGAEAAESSPLDVRRHLACHGIEAGLRALPASDEVGAGEEILSRAADAGADLVVMGAWGHSRLRELVLGGATREMLDHMTVPVLMSH